MSGTLATDNWSFQKTFTGGVYYYNHETENCETRTITERALHYNEITTYFFCDGDGQQQ